MGIIAGLVVISLWALHLFYALLNVNADAYNLWMYVHVAFQIFLYTGLFITAHDSMHGSVSSKKMINRAIGYTASFLFAALSYKKLIRNHSLHHKAPGTRDDPDYNIISQNFLQWFFRFMKNYLTFLQLVIMAVLFNIFQLFLPSRQIIAFWIIPSILSTVQLFYFGTYIPHRPPHTKGMLPHKARTLKKNHFWAMISCYFFGYHYEHHENPRIPWWQMYKTKNFRSQTNPLQDSRC